LPSDDRRIAFLFGALGAILLVLDGLIDFVGGFVFIAFGLGSHALGAWERSILFVVVGFIVGVFAFYGLSGQRDRAFASGVILVVLAVVGWLGLGFGGGILELLASIFTLISGILYLLSAR
jgi:hypothetical protein